MIGRTLWRAFRTAIAIGGAIVLKNFFNIPELIWTAPLLTALGKYLRDKHPKTWDWLPF